MLHRACDVRTGQAGIIGRSIVIAGPSDQSIPPQVRFLFQHLLSAERVMPANPALSGEKIVDREANPELPLRHSRPAVNRPCELEWLHQMWGNPEKSLSFANRFPDEADLSVLQVTNAAVN